MLGGQGRRRDEVHAEQAVFKSDWPRVHSVRCFMFFYEVVIEVQP